MESAAAANPWDPMTIALPAGLFNGAQKCHSSKAASGVRGTA